MQSWLKLVETVKKLRAPGGCPWDREQTHKSLRPFLIEEAYELLDCLDEISQSEFLVLEISSYQMETTPSLKPDVAVWLNITEDHLDWHENFEAYLAAKLKLIRHNNVELEKGLNGVLVAPHSHGFIITGRHYFRSIQRPGN